VVVSARSKAELPVITQAYATVHAITDAGELGDALTPASWRHGECIPTCREEVLQEKPVVAASG
jgi:hypothetical protein